MSSTTQEESEGFFRVACEDAARIVSILSIDSSAFTRPREKNSFWRNAHEKATFFGRFFYMVFVKGFTPTIFDLMPYRLWQLLSTAVYIYRLVVLPLWLKLTGFGACASWTNPQLGSMQPKKGSEELLIADSDISLVAEARLAKVDFGDVKYEKFLHALYGKTVHLSPHTQSPGHPFVPGFPGNFLDHLTGVYKILLAWKQPRHVVRAGLFHSVYGTFDYRSGVYDLRAGREDLRSLIGAGAEELAFAICTSDRIGLLCDLMGAMYGYKNVSRYGVIAKEAIADNITDGNPTPPLISELSAEGFGVRNHITQVLHVMPPHFFAQFCVVMIADFMDQGVCSVSSADMDICLFRFLRFRFYSDLLQYVSKYLISVPPVFKKYMLGNKKFIEPSRMEIMTMKRLFAATVNAFDVETDGLAVIPAVNISVEDRAFLYSMIQKYPYMLESRVMLATTLRKEEKYKVRKKCA